MALMKAMVVREIGGPEVLHMEEVTRPTPGEGEVLVRVHAAAVNPLDWKMRSGYYTWPPSWQVPLILGFDVAGVVEALGAGVSNFAVGDEVFGAPDPGGYAEYAIVQAEVLAHKPAGIDFVQAAALPISGLTAWQSLFEGAVLQAGQRLLIQGAAGGVGCFAVQLAKLHGAYVIGTASAHNLDFLRELGADEVIDYNRTNLEEALGAQPVDVIFDTVGGEAQARLLRVLKPEGVLVTIAGSPEMEQAPQVKPFDVSWESPSDAQLAVIAHLVETGQLKVIISKVFPFEEAAEAHRLLQGRHVRGKLVLQVIG